MPFSQLLTRLMQIKQWKGSGEKKKKKKGKTHWRIPAKIYFEHMIQSRRDFNYNLGDWKLTRERTGKDGAGQPLTNNEEWNFSSYCPHCWGRKEWVIQSNWQRKGWVPLQPVVVWRVTVRGRGFIEIKLKKKNYGNWEVNQSGLRQSGLKLMDGN